MQLSVHDCILSDVHLTNRDGCLFSVLQNIADSRPKVRYIVAVDDSKTKLRSIITVI